MIRKFITGVTLFLTIFSTAITPVLADNTRYHEDPDVPQQIFSGISLLHYYSDSLDTVLQRNPEATEAALEIMPFASIPPELVNATTDFSVFGIALSHSITELFELWQQQNELLGRYQLHEAVRLGEQMAEGLPPAREQLRQLTLAAESTGDYLNVGSALPQSEIKLAYDEIIYKLGQLEAMLDLLSRPLFDGIIPGLTPEELEELLKTVDLERLKDLLSDGLIPGLTPEKLEELLKTEDLERLEDLLKDIFKPTTLTLYIEPLEAFVGDDVDFTVVLDSNGEPLGNRNVDLIVDNTRHSTVTTNAQGYFEGKLQIPYRYLPTLAVRAIYYPEDNDIGVYLGSASELVYLAVKYYSATLDLKVDGLISPGQTPVLSGTFDYGQSPVMDKREVMLYLGDVEKGNFEVGTTFEIPLHLPPEIELGNHTLTASSHSNERYAPVVSSYILNVTRVETICELDMPGMAFIPGNIDLAGKLYSETGPLENATIISDINGSTARIYSTGDGSFAGQMVMGMDFGLLGYRQYNIQITPGEPWNAPLTMSGNIFIINFVNLITVLAALAAISLFLHFRLRRYSSKSIDDSFSPAGVAGGIPASAFVATHGNDTTAINYPRKDTLYNSIINLYIQTLKLVQKMVSVNLKPEQTLREYAAQTHPKLGFPGRIFVQFTHFVEKLIYSAYKPTDEDVGKSQQLSSSIKAEGALK